MSVRVATPAGASEILQLRRRHSKLFALPQPGKFRAVADVVPIHWFDGQNFRDVDTEWEDEGGGLYRCRSAHGRWDFDTTTFTLIYDSRSSGFIRLRLLSINGAPPNAVTPTLSPDGERLRLVGVGAGVSLMVASRPQGPEIFRRYSPAATPPVVLVWRVDESLDLGTIRTNILSMQGWDNFDLSDAGRSSEVILRNRRRRVEVSIVKGAETIVGGGSIRRYQVTETLTGRTIWRDPVTRVPEFRSGELVFPVVVDVEVVEDIAVPDISDDGYGYVAGASETWVGYYNNLSFGPDAAPAWRWKTLAIPQGATIDSAILRLKVNNTGDMVASLWGEAIDSAAFWTHSGAYGPNRMTRTSASIAFSSFSATGFTTRDVTTIVQEIINRAGWASDNNLRLGATDATAGSNSVMFETTDYDPSGAGRLTVNYTAGGVALRRLLMLGVG